LLLHGHHRAAHLHLLLLLQYLLLLLAWGEDGGEGRR